MFGSQALETAIGLALLFFVLATAASAVVELVAKRLKKRHKDLELAIEGMLKGQPVNWSGSSRVDAAFRATTVYQSAEVAAGRAGVVYMSAKSFADAAVELARTAANVPPGLVNRMEQLRTDANGDLLAIKAGLESWFDATMGALESQYKKWATTWLFFIGLALAVLTNASAVNVASDLWNDSTTRAAVVAAAEGVVREGQEASDIKDVATTADELTALKLPVGWDSTGRDDLGSGSWWVSHLVGWLLTGALLMLGAPFWFDLLSRLVSLRNAGKAPPPAADDPSSATAQRALGGAAAPAAPVAGSGSGTGGVPQDLADVLSRTGSGTATVGGAATARQITGVSGKLIGR